MLGVSRDLMERVTVYNGQPGVRCMGRVVARAGWNDAEPALRYPGAAPRAESTGRQLLAESALVAG